MVRIEYDEKKGSILCHCTCINYLLQGTIYSDIPYSEKFSWGPIFRGMPIFKVFTILFLQNLMEELESCIALRTWSFHFAGLIFTNRHPAITAKMDLTNISCSGAKKTDEWVSYSGTLQNLKQSQSIRPLQRDQQKV